MSVRYTLRLVANGAEVWKRWTGDREEVRQIALTGLVQIGATARVAGMFLAPLDQDLAPDQRQESVAYSPDLASSLELQMKGSNVSSE